jgi:hypothetical protein
MNFNIIITSLLFISCSPVIINQNHYFNEEDREYIIARLNHDMECLSYYLKNCKESKIFIEFDFNKNGKTKNVTVLNKTLSNSVFSKEIKLFYKDSCHDFTGIEINKERKFKFAFTFINSANSPCFKPCDGENLNDIIINHDFKN